jgi:hypothetical protein
LPFTKLRLPQRVVTGFLCVLGAPPRRLGLTPPGLRGAPGQRRWRPQRRLRTPIVEWPAWWRVWKAWQASRQMTSLCGPYREAAVRVGGTSRHRR